MAYRIHFVGIFNATDTDVQAAMGPLFEGCQDPHFERDDPWWWSAFSVWQVSSRKIESCLRKLASPSLLFTTEDGMRWHLTMYEKGEQRLYFCHEFGLMATSGFDGGEDEWTVQYLWVAGISNSDDNFDALAFLWDEEEAARVLAEKTAERESYVAGKALVEEAHEYGYSLPAELTEQLIHEPDELKARQVCLDWQYRAIREVLGEWGLRLDEQKLADCFDPACYTEEEVDSDLGNLPRLVQAMGMVSAFAEDDDEADECDPRSSADREMEVEPSDGPNEPDLPETHFGVVEGEAVATSSGDSGLSEEMMEEFRWASMSMVEQWADDCPMLPGRADLPQNEKIGEVGPVEIFGTDATPLLETHHQADIIKRTRIELMELDFEHVGDMICPALGGLVVVCFAGPRQRHAQIVVDICCTRFFRTRFENGDFLTTNNEDNSGESNANVGHYFLSYDRLPMSLLLEKHEQGVEKFRRHKSVSPIDHPADLAAFGHFLAEFLSRATF